MHTFNCTTCSASFKTKPKLLQHSQTHRSIVNSNSVNRNSYSASSSTSSNAGSEKLKFVCMICQKSYHTYYQLRQHKKDHKKEKSTNDTNLNDLSEFEQNEKLLDEVTSVQRFLKDEKIELKRKKIYNFRVFEINTTFLQEKIKLIYDGLERSAKINFAFGSVLQGVEQDEWFKYYYPADNNTVFPSPMILSNQTDLSTVLDAVESSQILELLIARN